MAVVMSLVATLLLVLMPQQEIEVRALRFYRGGTTLVDAFYSIPFSILSALPGGGGAYRVDITVRDSSGLVLTSASWSTPVGADLLRTARASVVEHFAFAAERGRFEVEVAVVDSASGARRLEKTTVGAFETAPSVSDVLTSSAMRRVTTGDTATRPGEVRKGSVYLVSATRPVLTPQDGTLYYYAELYPGRSTNAEVSVRVRAADGREVFAAEPHTVAVRSAGGVTASSVNLAGLPPGGYRLQLGVRYGDDSVVVRESQFEVATFSAVAAAREAESGSDEYATLDVATLDSLYAPLVHIMESEERGVFEGLSLDGKRTYLRRFWAKRDESPSTVRNEFRDEYYRRIADANGRFREGGAGQVDGWRTDRGRILIRYGEPDEKLSRPQNGMTPPYEVWKYTRGRPRKFVFQDQTRFGHYALVYTDERREPSLPDWESILGREAAQDVKSF